MIGGRWRYVGLVSFEEIVIFAGSMNLLLKDIKHVVDNRTGFKVLKEMLHVLGKVLKCCC